MATYNPSLETLLASTRDGYSPEARALACAQGGRKVLHGAAGALYEGPWPGRYYVVPHNQPGALWAVCCPQQGAHVAGVQWPKVRTQHGKLCLHSKKGEL
jgi:hypothetical protein